MAQLTETCFERVNRLALERKATHTEWMAALVFEHSDNFSAFGQIHESWMAERAAGDWWADQSFWAEPGWSPSEIEASVYERLCSQSFLIRAKRLLLGERLRRPLTIKAWRPLAEVHVDHLLESIVIDDGFGGIMRVFDPIDLTESEVAVR